MGVLGGFPTRPFPVREEAGASRRARVRLQKSKCPPMRVAVIVWRLARWLGGRPPFKPARTWDERRRAAVVVAARRRSRPGAEWWMDVPPPRPRTPGPLPLASVRKDPRHRRRRPAAPRVGEPPTFLPSPLLACGSSSFSSSALEAPRAGAPGRRPSPHASAASAPQNPEKGARCGAVGASTRGAVPYPAMPQGPGRLPPVSAHRAATRLRAEIEEGRSPRATRSVANAPGPSSAARDGEPDVNAVGGAGGAGGSTLRPVGPMGADDVGGDGARAAEAGPLDAHAGGVRSRETPRRAHARGTTGSLGGGPSPWILPGEWSGARRRGNVNRADRG